MKKILSGFLIMAMLFIAVPMTLSGGVLPFKDVSENDGFFSKVGDVYNRGIMIGKSKEIFAPLENITRAELVAALSRIAEDDISALDTSAFVFSDIKAGEWHVDYVG